MSDLNQVEFVSLYQLVDKNHPYRQLLAIVDFEKLCKPIRDLDNVGRSDANGYGIVTLFQCLMLQFIEDISDRNSSVIFAKTHPPNSSAALAW